MKNIHGRNVILCCPGFPSSADSADKPFLLDHAQAIRRLGIEVTVICPSVPGLPSRSNIEGVKVIRVRYAPRRLETLASTGAMYKEANGWRGVFVIPMLIALLWVTLKEARQNRSFAIHGHWWVPGGFVATVTACLMRSASIVHLHGSDVVIAKSKGMRFLARRVMRSANFVAAVSEPLREWGEAVSGREILAMAMPINIDRFPDPVEAPVDGPILAVGRLVKEKGFDILISAVALLEADKKFRILIVGEGPERKALAEQAIKLGVELDLLGELSPGKLGEVYKSARFVVVPSRREGYGLVAAEAAASGRAVVGSRVGGIPDLLEDGVSGMLVEPGDVEQLSEALKMVDPNWGAAGLSKSHSLGMEGHSSELQKLYKKLIPK